MHSGPLYYEPASMEVPSVAQPSSVATKVNGKRHTTQRSVDAAIWSICDIMRRGNVASALQYVPELTWILFLRILDETEDREEQENDAVGASYSSSLRNPYRWKDWAAPIEASDSKPNKRKELEDSAPGALMAFINGELIPHLKKLKDRAHATPRQKVISEIMSGVEKVRIDTEKNLLDVLDKVRPDARLRAQPDFRRAATQDGREGLGRGPVLHAPRSCPGDGSSRRSEDR